jgi:hypothetical protein
VAVGGAVVVVAVGVAATVPVELFVGVAVGDADGAVVGSLVAVAVGVVVDVTAELAVGVLVGVGVDEGLPPWR